LRILGGLRIGRCTCGSGTLKGRTRLHALGLLGTIVCAVLLHLGGCGQEPRTGPAPNTGEAPRSASSTAAGAERYDLSRDEERGGHTLKKHVGRTDEELQERLRLERNISAASTWTDRETAETVVAEALRAERGRIENWVRRGYPRANLALHYDAGRPIGRSLRRGEDQTVPCTSAVTVLRADGPDSYFVLTTYPEARE
jgi:Bacterial CdiA-CT RNAse A domain